jgi:carbon starvation protein CstA
LGAENECIVGFVQFSGGFLLSLFPLKIDLLVWMVILSIYTLIAAGIPVWLVLRRHC